MPRGDFFISQGKAEWRNTILGRFNRYDDMFERVECAKNLSDVERMLKRSLNNAEMICFNKYKNNPAYKFGVNINGNLKADRI